LAALTTDVVVLGAGIVGVSAALHLQKRGRDVVIVDRRGAAGEETSFGNAGIIERSSIFPYMFPREPLALLRYGLNRAPEVHYHASALPRLLPWLWLYWRASSPAGSISSARALAPLIERSLAEHAALAEAAGVAHVLRRTGWTKLYRSTSGFARGRADAERLLPYGIAFDLLHPGAIAAREKHITGAFAGAVHFKDLASVADPSALVKSYADLFVARGGRLLTADARFLEEKKHGWAIKTAAGSLTARDALVALGPWSDDLLRLLGYSVPLGVKRGYHMHYGVRDGAILERPVLDVEGGFLLAPMVRGIRLTTGAEFALRDAPPTPVQIDRAEIRARRLFPLAERADAAPWMGARPCLPDMLPVIGAAPRHRRLWFDFGHQHLGLTLGPATGRLVAEMMTGEAPFADPDPYRLERFVRTKQA
jgi:D-amino-acid dehydrogenase